MTQEEMKNEMEAIIKQIPCCETDDDHIAVSNRMKKLRAEKGFPEELWRMFMESDTGAMFYRRTGRGIMD